MKFHDTIPIEPDWYKYYTSFPHRTSARVKFEDTDDCILYLQILPNIMIGLNLMILL